MGHLKEGGTVGGGGTGDEEWRIEGKDNVAISKARVKITGNTN